MALEERVEVVSQPGEFPATLASVLEGVLRNLLPTGGPHWELHCQFHRDERGCTDIHLHTCTQQLDQEKPKEEAGPHGAYL